MCWRGIRKLSIEEQKVSRLWVRAGPGYFWGSFQLISWVLRELAPNPGSTMKKTGALKWPVHLSGPQESEVVSLTLVLITIATIF